MKNANIIWSDENLDKWLRSPQSMVPGNKMFIIGISNPAERSDLIAYFKTFDN